jgi:hypothetical protein
MRTIFFWSFLLFAVSIMPVRGQHWRATQYQFHAGLGLANYFGDIGGSADENTLHGIKDLDLARTRPSFVTGLRYFTGSHLALNGVITIGWLTGNDTGWKNDGRGYSFNTIIFEPSVRFELYPLRDYQFGSGVDRRGMRKNYSTISAYVFGGVGAAVYNVFPNESLIARRERDEIEHGLITMVLPAGLGLKVGINNNTDIGIEIGGRFALGDHIDGLTTVTSTARDIYYITSVQMLYRLPGPGSRSR